MVKLIPAPNIRGAGYPVSSVPTNNLFSMDCESLPRVFTSGSNPGYDVNVYKLVAFTYNIALENQFILLTGKLYDNCTDFNFKYDPSNINRSDGRICVKALIFGYFALGSGLSSVQ